MLIVQDCEFFYTALGNRFHNFYAAVLAMRPNPVENEKAMLRAINHLKQRALFGDARIFYVNRSSVLSLPDQRPLRSNSFLTAKPIFSRVNGFLI